MIQLREVYEDSNFIYIIMDYMQGGTLRDYLTKKGMKLNNTQVRDLAHQILSAVETIHERGFIHRDLKLDNILVDVSESAEAP